MLGTALLAVTVAACGDDNANQPAGSGSDQTEPASPLPQSDDPTQPDPDQLNPEITNPWFPLEPGTRWTYSEISEDGEKLEVVVTASSETVEIANGATARVVRDTVTLDGEIIEDTLDWYAQDEAGTVWYLGEDTAEFENGKITTREGSFEAGVDGALPGVIMPGEPTVGMEYRQEYYEGVAEDNGAVIGTDQQASVPAGEYDGLLQTADTNALEPKVLEHKFYADGVGLVLTLDPKDKGREELLSVEQLSPAESRRAGTADLGEAY